MRTASHVARRKGQCRRTAQMAIVITVAVLTSTAAGGSLGFDEIPEPSWIPVIRAPEEIVPRTEHPTTASWLCLDGADPKTPVELRRLIRLSVVLEAARSSRAEALAARGVGPGSRLPDVTPEACFQHVGRCDSRTRPGRRDPS